MQSINTEPKTQGKRITKARELTFLSRRAFAIKYKLNPSSLQAWEEGRYKKGISIETASLLSEILKLENIRCTPEWIMHGIGETPKRTIDNVLQTKPLSREYYQKKIHFYANAREQNQKLISAIKKNQPQLVLKLISDGATLHQLEKNKLYLYSSLQNTALHFSAAYSGKEIISTFIKLGTHPDVRNRNNEAPIHLACFENNLKAIEALLNFGANIESGSRGHESNTPLMWSAFLGYQEACKILLKYNAKINNTNSLGNTAMHWASYNNQTEIIYLLYKHGAIPDIPNHQGEKPIDWALKNGQRQALQALINISY